MKYQMKKPNSHRFLGMKPGSTPVDGEVFQIHEYQNISFYDWHRLEKMGFIERVPLKKRSNVVAA